MLVDNEYIHGCTAWLCSPAARGALLFICVFWERSGSLQKSSRIAEVWCARLSGAVRERSPPSPLLVVLGMPRPWWRVRGARLGTGLSDSSPCGQGSPRSGPSTGGGLDLAPQGTARCWPWAGAALVLPPEGFPVFKLAEAIPVLIRGPQQSGFAAVSLPTRLRLIHRSTNRASGRAQPIKVKN